MNENNDKKLETQEPTANELNSSKTKDALMNLLNSSAEEGNQYVTFKIDDEEYALDINRVQEITGYTKLTKLPNAHKSIKGMFNLRGNVIPIFDLRIKFKLKEKEYDKFSVIIVFRTNNKTIGMIVDEVSDVLNIDKDKIQDAPDLSMSIDTQFIEGVGKVGEKLIIVLNLEKLLSEDEINKIQSI